jgi:capsular exopolysaccharide synthesis family protein
MEEQSLLNVVWRGRYLILLTTAVCAAVALLFALRSPKVYEASATLQVHSPSIAPDPIDPVREQQASQGLAKTYATLIDDRSMLEQIAPRVAGGTLSASRLARKVRASAIEETALVGLTVSDGSPAGARRLARQLASGFIAAIDAGVNRRLEEQQGLLEDRISTINTEIRTLRESSPNPGTPAVAEQLESLRRARAALTTELATVIAHGIQEGGALSLVGAPTARSAPVSPRPRLSLMAGILLGLLLGIALAALRMRIDRGLHSAEEAEGVLEVPVLASIPLRRTLRPEDRALSEAYDVLYANLAFHSTDRGLSVVTFSSYNPREGKSTTVAGLTAAAARGGAGVLVIDGDLRTGGLSQHLGYYDAPGLTELILDTASPDDALVQLAPDVVFLPAGQTTTNPPGLLSSGRMRELVEDFQAQHQLVIIDAPAIAHMADASILTSLSNGVVIVARVGSTQRADLRSAAADLRHTSVPVIGLVVLERRTAEHPYLAVPGRIRHPAARPLERS